MKRLIFLLTFFITIPIAAQTFSNDWTKVPVQFKGHNFDAIYRALTTSPLTQPKGPYETTEDYNKRKERADKIVIAPGVRVENDIALVYRPSLQSEDTHVTYDADKGVFRIELYFESPTYLIKLNNPNSTAFSMRVAPDNRVAAGSYVGRNLLGLPFTIRKFTVTKRHFITNNFDSADPDIKKNRKMVFEVACPPEKARSVRASFAFLLVASPSWPLRLESTYTSDPTIDNRTAVTENERYLTGFGKALWLYNASTGEIYKKVEFKIVPESEGKKPPVAGTPAATPTKVVTPEPEIPPSLKFSEAEKAFADGKYEPAAKLITGVLAEDPMNARAYLLKGKVERKMKNPQSAVSLFKSAIFWDGKLTEAYIELSQAYTEMHDCAGAATYINQALQIDPKNSDAITQQVAVKKCTN